MIINPNNNKLRILFDMDDVLENLCDAWVAYLNKRYSLCVRDKDITQWDMRKAFPTLTAEQIFAPLNETALWETVNPLPFAPEIVKKLKEKHEVLVVTAATPESIEPKLKLVLFRYFPFSMNDVIIASKKQLVQGDILVDDNPKNLIGGTYQGILMDRVHNRSFDNEAYGIKRVYDWLQIYDAITDFQTTNTKEE